MKVLHNDGHIDECPADEVTHVVRHSAAHVLAQAVKRLYPQADFAYGPATDNGFYYDVDLGDVKLSEDDLPAIEDEMRRIAMEVGPHVTYTKALKAFKLTGVSGAYWKADANNKMLTRVNGTAFATKDELEAHLQMLEEAKKRDHRRIGREMDLFMMRDEAPGFPFFLPNGMILKNTLLDYWREIHHEAGYVEISTPQIMNKQLCLTSGQLTDEIVGVVRLIDSVYQKFGFKYHVELSTRPDDSMGSDEVLPVSEKSRDFAHEVTEQLDAAGIRVVCDDRDEKIGY